jgi:hypothetical protein
VVYDWARRDLSRSASDAQASNVEGHRVLGYARGAFTPSPRWGLDLGLDHERRTATSPRARRWSSPWTHATA